MGRCHFHPWWYFWGLVNGQPFLSNFELFNGKFVLLPKDVDIWICESKYASEVVSGFGHRVPSDFLSQVSASPFSYINFNNRFSYIKLKNQAKKHLWKTLELFSFFLLVISFIKLYQRHNGPLSGLAKVKGCGKKSGYFSWLLPLSVGLRLNFITSTEHQQQNIDQTSRLILIIRWKKVALITQYSVQPPLPANQPTVFSLETQKC